jgi:glyoxylase-like metal-dependent hydrolase (beta-lactamase superfamily II)/predicted esterase
MKNRLLMLAAAIAASLVPGAAIAQPAATHLTFPETPKLAALFKADVLKGEKGSTLSYRYFSPTAKSPDNGKYPVILYLHGEQEAGTDNNAQLITTDCATVWVTPAHQAQHPVYVLAPQIAKGKLWTDEAVYSDTLALLNRFLKSHSNADTNRVYIVGFSMGATGMWKMLLKNPRLFAAAMPISGSADAFLGDKAAWAALKNTPVIIIHSYDDMQVPVAAALNASAALQSGGNSFLGFGAPTPCIWSPASTPSPHDAWYTAFHKFEVVYNSLFWGDLGRTHDGQIDPTTLYQSHSMGDGVTQVWDYALGTSWVVERGNNVMIVDTTMGHGGLYQYIRDHVLVNKSAEIEIFLSHQHDDHIRGLASFIGADQLKNVYAGKQDTGPIVAMLGPDGNKVHAVKDGDLFPLGDSDAEVISVPGHTAGSIVVKYKRYLFTGDSIGTGYIGVGALSAEQYLGSLQHLLDRMGPGHYSVYAGHTGELIAPIGEQYVHDLVSVARGMIAGTINMQPYWRSGESATRKVSTVNRSSITYQISAIHTVKAALRSLTVSSGNLVSGYASNFYDNSRAPGFSPALQLYYVVVDADTSTLAITPTAADANYKSLTVNGAPVRSGESYNVALNPGLNSVAITVTADDGLSRTYSIDVRRGAH